MSFVFIVYSREGFLISFFILLFHEHLSLPIIDREDSISDIGCVSTQSHKHVFQVGFTIRDFNNPHPEKILASAGNEPTFKNSEFHRAWGLRLNHLRHRDSSLSS